MIHASNVTFKKTTADIESPTGPEQREMDVVEITYPDGKVIAFPADDVSPEDGRRYREIYQAKYDAFKNGEPDPDKVSALERDIKEKQDELDALNKPNDDWRVQENLGYGKNQRPHSADQKTTAKAQPAQIVDQPAPLGKVPANKQVRNPAPNKAVKKSGRKSGK